MTYHRLISAAQTSSIPQFMGYLKRKSAMMITSDMQIKNTSLEAETFGQQGTAFSTVELTTATIQKNIREQKKLRSGDSLSKKYTNSLRVTSSQSACSWNR